MALFTASKTQAATYLLGVCLFSISFLVFLNSSVSFVVTDIIGERQGVGNAVGTLGFADELVALIACPVWGLLSDRIGVRIVCVIGYAIVGLALLLFVQASNVYPQLLLARMFFSIGGAATTTMVTAILPSMTTSGSHVEESRLSLSHDISHVNGRAMSPSISSELTITPARLQQDSIAQPSSSEKDKKGASSTRLAGVVGLFTGCGALVALALFLPLPARFQRLGIAPGPALADTYYVVGSLAILVSIVCFIGLRSLAGEQGKSLRLIYGASPVREGFNRDKQEALPYWRLLTESIRLGIEDPLIGLGYLGGFVARASSVGISLFIPLFVNSYFISSGLCKIDDPIDIKSQCRQAYILAAELTGASQLTALLFAPVFGYLADRYRLYNIPLLCSAVVGIVGYSAFASLKSPQPSGESGNPAVFLVVALLGISQIGAIVCSLGLLGRGISGLEQQAEKATATRPITSEEQGVANRHIFADDHDRWPSLRPERFPERLSQDEIGGSSSQESTALLQDSVPEDQSRIHLKGSIAGVYSLSGGAGILLLTKLGGYLFDVKSPSSPFIMLAIFNLLLLLGGIGFGFAKFFGRQHKSGT